MKVSLSYEIVEDDGVFRCKTESAIDDEPLIGGDCTFFSLLEAIDDARFQADANIALLRDLILKQQKGGPQAP